MQALFLTKMILPVEKTLFFMRSYTMVYFGKNREVRPRPLSVKDVFFLIVFPVAVSILLLSAFPDPSLARISHQPSAATANMPASTALRSLGLLNIPSGTPTSPSLRAPCICGHLRCFATMPGEKSGLTLSISFAIQRLSGKAGDPKSMEDSAMIVFFAAPGQGR